MIHYRYQGIRLGRVLAWFVFVMTLAACGAVHHEIRLNPDFSPRPETSIGIGTVTNATGQTFDVQIEDMFREALNDELKDENLLSTGADGHKLVLATKIVEYEKGNAFKRWLLPGWGDTVLSIQCDLMDGDRLVGNIEARRTIAFGGGYTIGEWKRIFNRVAIDIVSDLREKISGHSK